MHEQVHRPFIAYSQHVFSGAFGIIDKIDYWEEMSINCSVFNRRYVVCELTMRNHSNVRYFIAVLF